VVVEGSVKHGRSSRDEFDIAISKMGKSVFSRPAILVLGSVKMAEEYIQACQKPGSQDPKHMELPKSCAYQCPGCWTSIFINLEVLLLVISLNVREVACPDNGNRSLTG
jgi:hypothetical protein